MLSSLQYLTIIIFSTPQIQSSSGGKKSLLVQMIMISSSTSVNESLLVQVMSNECNPF